LTWYPQPQAIPSEITKSRIAGIDALRGLALIFMVIDHAIVVLSPGEFTEVRQYLTRFSLPLFMIIAGYCFKPTYTKRTEHVALVALAVTPFVLMAGMAPYHILFVYLLVLPFMYLADKFPVLLMSTAIIQMTTFPIGWHGYEPGLVLLLLLFGNSLKDQLATEVHLAQRFLMPLHVVGQWPLSIYFFHIVLLAAWVNL